jgi:thioredoxin-dependent peroxiredoxin
MYEEIYMSNAAEKLSHTLTIGDTAPSFTVTNQHGVQQSSADYVGKHIILYFYPKDDTPGCTTEAKDFSTLKDEFSALGAVVVGVSKDSAEKHAKFIAKHDLAVELLADEAGDMCDAYGTWVEKSMYGKKYMGIERATYLIDNKGIIRGIWRNVKVKDHAADVLKAVKAL